MDQLPTKKRKQDDSDSDDSDSDDATFYTIETLSNVAKTGLNAFKIGVRRLKENPDDQIVQDKYDSENAELHPDLRNFRAKRSAGQSELDNIEIYKSLYKLIELVDTKGNPVEYTLYDYMMEKVDAESSNFEIVKNFLGLDFSKRLYVLIVWLSDSGEYLKIPIGAYRSESVIKDEVSDTFYNINDIYPFEYGMKNGKLEVIPRGSLYFLDLNGVKHNVGIIEEISKHLTVWDESKANKLAKEAIEKILEEIAKKKLGDRGIRAGDQFGLCEYKPETDAKANLSMISRQTPLSASNLGDLLAKYMIGDKLNLGNFKVHTLEGLPPSDTRIDDDNRLKKLKKAAMISSSIKMNAAMREKDEEFKAEAKQPAINPIKRVQTEEQKRTAQARLAALNASNYGGAKTKNKKTKYKKSKKSKKHMKTKKHRKSRKYKR